jgi:hypothetical protein
MFSSKKAKPILRYIEKLLIKKITIISFVNGYIPLMKILLFFRNQLKSINSKNSNLLINKISNIILVAPFHTNSTFFFRHSSSLLTQVFFLKLFDILFLYGRYLLILY